MSEPSDFGAGVWRSRVLEFLDGHAAVSGRSQATWGTPYGSDLRLMTNMGGVPTVHYGPGDASLAHAPRESVPVSELLTAARALTLVALEYCGTR